MKKYQEMLTAEESQVDFGSQGLSPSFQSRRESWVSVSSRRNSRVLQNDLLLHEAVIKNEPEAVEKILREPVDVNSRNNFFMILSDGQADSNFSFYDFRFHSHFPLMGFSVVPNLRYGRAPIHWASSRGSTEIMEMLINAKCDIEAQDKYGMRPILMSAWHGHTDATRLLVNAGASVNAVNKKNYTLLMCAAKNNRVDVINFLEELLEDLKVNELDVDNQTALHHAAAGGHLESVKKLVQLGAKIDCVDRKNRSPLHCAAEKGHVEVVEFLLQNDADLIARDQDGNVPIHLSTENKQTRATQALLEYGNPPDIPNEKGLTALHIASDFGCRGIIDSLLQHGANINAQTKTGNTPLHLACRNNEPDIVELLISKGADVNKLNFRLESPIHIAAEYGHSDIVQMLLAAGANIQIKEQGGKTPLYVAARGSFTAIVDMIIKTARLDYSSSEDDAKNEVKGNVLKKIGKSWRQPNGRKGPRTVRDHNEKLRSIFYQVAYKQLEDGEWRRLAMHWSFTQEQIKAIEHQYTGNSSYKEHGFRMMLIWAHGLSAEMNPVKELYEALIAVGNKKAADGLRKNVDKENGYEHARKRRSIWSCLIL